VTTRSDFNPRLRDAEGVPLAAPVRGSLRRPDFGDRGPAVDPSAVRREAEERIAASAARNPRGRMDSSPSQGFAIESLGRLVQQLSAELTVVRQRLSELEAQQRKPAA